MVFQITRVDSAELTDSALKPAVVGIDVLHMPSAIDADEREQEQFLVCLRDTGQGLCLDCFGLDHKKRKHS